MALEFLKGFFETADEAWERRQKELGHPELRKFLRALPEQFPVPPPPAPPAVPALRPTGVSLSEWQTNLSLRRQLGDVTAPHPEVHMTVPTTVPPPVDVIGVGLEYQKRGVPGYTQRMGPGAERTLIDLPLVRSRLGGPFLETPPAPFDPSSRTWAEKANLAIWEPWYEIVRPWGALALRGVGGVVRAELNLSALTERIRKEGFRDMDAYWKSGDVPVAQAGMGQLPNFVAGAGYAAAGVLATAPSFLFNTILNGGVRNLMSGLLLYPNARDAVAKTMRDVVTGLPDAATFGENWTAARKGDLTAYEVLWGEKLSDYRDRLQEKKGYSEEYAEFLAFTSVRNLSSVLFDVGFDPLMYVSFGAGRVTKLASKEGEIALKASGVRWMQAQVNDAVRVLREAKPYDWNSPEAMAKLELIGRGVPESETMRLLERQTIRETRDLVQRQLREATDIVGHGGNRLLSDGRLLPVEPEVVESAKKLTREMIDRGGLKIHYPKFAFEKPWLEWAEKTALDTQTIRNAFSRVAIAAHLSPMPSGVAKAALPIQMGARAALGLLNPNYNAWGRIPLGLRRMVTDYRNEYAFLEERELRFFDDVATANKLTAPEQDLLRTALDADVTVANERMEAIRKQLMNDAGFAEAWRNKKQYRNVVDYIADEHGVDTAAAFVILKAHLNDTPLVSERLEAVRQKVKGQWETYLQMERAVGLNVQRVMGGGYMPRPGARPGWEELLTKAVEQTMGKDQSALDAWLFQEATGRWRPRGGGGADRPQFFQKPRGIYRMRGVDGNSALWSADAISKGTRTTVDNVLGSVTQNGREHLATLETMLRRVEQQIDNYLARSGGLHADALRTAIAEKEDEIARFIERYAAPEKDAQRALRRLGHERESLLRQFNTALKAANAPTETQLIYDVTFTKRAIQDELGDVARMAAQMDGKQGVFARIDRLKELADGLELRSLRARAEASTTGKRPVRPMGPATTQKLAAMREEIAGLIEHTGSIDDFSENIAARKVQINKLRDGLERDNRAMALSRQIDDLTLATQRSKKIIAELQQGHPGAGRGATIADMLTEERARLRTYQTQLTAAKKLGKAETAGAAVQKRVDAAQALLSEQIAALMERIPLGADEVWLYRQKLERAGLYTTGSRVRLSAQENKLGEVVGMIRQEDKGNPHAGLVAAAEIEEGLTDKYRVVVRTDDGNLTDVAAREIAYAPNYDHISAYTREKAFVDEVDHDWGQIYEPEFLRAAASRSRAHARAYSAAEFFNELKTQGWAVKIEDGAARPGWVESQFGHLKGYEVQPQVEYLLTSVFRAQRRARMGVRESMAYGDLWGAVTAAAEELNSMWKGSVTALWADFHGQNALSNVWLNMMDLSQNALDPRRHVLAGEILAPKWGLEAKTIRAERLSQRAGVEGEQAKQALELLNQRVIIRKDSTGRTWTWGELRTLLKEHDVALTGTHYGVMDMKPGDYRTFGPRRTVAAGAKRAAAAGVAFGAAGTWMGAPVAGAGFGLAVGAGGPAALRFGRVVGNAVEDQARLVNFFSNLQKFGDPITAAEHTKMFLFDYQALTPFARNVMRQLVPFWTFGAKNTALHVKLAWQKPAALVRAAHIADWVQQYFMEPALTDEERAMLPDYQRGQMGIVTSRDGWGLKLLNNFGVPLQHLGEEMAGFPRSGAMGAASLTPYLRSPLEVLFKYNLYFGKHLDQPQYVDELMSVINLLPKRDRAGLMRFMQVYEKDDGHWVAQKGVAAYVVRNILFTTRAWSEVRSLTKQGAPISEKVMDMVMGIDLRGYNEDDLNRMAGYYEREVEKQRRIQERTEEAIGAPYAGAGEAVEGMLEEVFPVEMSVPTTPRR